MFRVRNTALDKIFANYGITSLDELSDDQMLEVCADLQVNPSVRLNNKKRFEKLERRNWIKKIGKDRVTVSGTIERIEAALSITFYMDDSYWTEKHRQVAEDRNFYERLDTSKSGTEIFDFYEELGIGVKNLKPAASADLDLTKRFINEVILNPEFHYKNLSMEITDLDTNAIVFPVPESAVDSKNKEKKDQSSEEVYTREYLQEKSHKELVSIAKKKHINTFGMSSSKLINQILI